MCILYLNVLVFEYKIKTLSPIFIQRILFNSVYSYAFIYLFLLEMISANSVF